MGLKRSGCRNNRILDRDNAVRCLARRRTGRCANHVHGNMSSSMNGAKSWTPDSLKSTWDTRSSCYEYRGLLRACTGTDARIRQETRRPSGSTSSLDLTGLWSLKPSGMASSHAVSIAVWTDEPLLEDLFVDVSKGTHLFCQESTFFYSLRIIVSSLP